MVDIIFRILVPLGRNLSFFGEKLKLSILRISSSELISDLTTSILAPSLRSQGPLTQQQVLVAIPGSPPVGKSFMLIWPQYLGISRIHNNLLCSVLHLIYEERDTC